MILTIGNTKGGTGKSTFAVNIAIHRAKSHSVLLVDGDEQQSALSFTQLRNRQDYVAVALTGTQIRSQVPKLAVNYPEIIIDVGGRDSGSFRAALTITHRLLIPIQPRTFDMWAMETVATLIDEAKTFNPSMRCYAVLNLADVQGSDNKYAETYMIDFSGIQYLDCPIYRRKAYSDSISQGKGIEEFKPRNSKAINEFNQLVSFVYHQE